MKRHLLTLMVLVLAATALAQDCAIFSHASSGEPLYMWGFSRKENYNVAMAINNPALVGSEITAISVPIAATDHIISLSVWMSSELKLTKVDGKNANDPDILSINAEMPTENAEGLAYNFVTVNLPEPYVITEDPVYVGYSFVISILDEVTMAPIPMAQAVNPDGLYVFTSRTVKSWLPYSEEIGMVTPIRVELSATLPEYGLAVLSADNVVSVVSESNTTEVQVANMGSQSIHTIDYTVEVDGVSYPYHMALEKPLEANYGLATTLELEVPAIEAAGAYPMTVTIDKLDDQTNMVEHNSAEATLSVMGYIPEYRPLVEEFTGTGCQFCPRGYASMEYMREQHGNDFVGIAWHKYNSSDPMYVTAYPSLVSGYPGCVVNREEEMDPYYADESVNDYTFEAYWQELKDSTIAPVAIEVKGQLSDDCHWVDATATLDWQALPANADQLRVEFFLSCDDLTGEGGGWRQQSAFNSTAYSDVMLLSQFVGKGSKLDLVYNDCGLLTSGYGGIEGSVKDIELGKPVEVKYTFDLTKAVNYNAEFIPQDLTKLNVIAFVNMINGSKVSTVLNSAKNQVGVGSGVSGVASDAEVVATEWYNFAGVKVASEREGAVRVERLSDGKVRTSKVIGK